MALGSALVDRAFLLRKRPATPEDEIGPPEEVEGTVIEGTPIFKEPNPEDPEPGPEFRCRLDLSGTTERTKDGLTQTDPRPKLLTPAKDLDGNELEFLSSDQLKVVSKELGTAIWEVDDDPEPLRKRRTIIGWELTIHRVKEA